MEIIQMIWSTIACTLIGIGVGANSKITLGLGLMMYLQGVLYYLKELKSK